MDKDALQHYNKWLGKTPFEIRKHVIAAGGWTKVFPGDTKLPKWLHRLRNHFNEPPQMLLRVNKIEALIAINRIKLKGSGAKNFVVAQGASSGDVYKQRNTATKDEPGWRYWIEQSQAGSRFHSKEQRGLFGSAITPHSMTGNFKMCSPDGTGGSSETALHNWMLGWTGKFGESNSADVGEWINARTEAIVPDKYRGSYNFADSMDAGYDAHVRLDMDPDDKYGTKYVPEGRWIPINTRVFRRFDGDGLGVGPVERD